MIIVRMGTTAVLLSLFVAASAIAFAGKAKEAPEEATDDNDAERSKPSEAKTKQAGPAGKLARQLGSSFKKWDRNKDDSVDMEELEKFYSRFKAKPKKKRGQVEEENAPDPMAAVAAMHAKMDGDQDSQVSREEFDAWAEDVAEYLTKYVELYERRWGIQTELAKVQAILARNRNVTAIEGVLNDELSKGVFQYERMIEDVDGEVEKLDTDGGHAEYRDFLLSQLFRGKRR